MFHTICQIFILITTWFVVYFESDITDSAVSNYWIIVVDLNNCNRISPIHDQIIQCNLW